MSHDKRVAYVSNPKYCFQYSFFATDREFCFIFRHKHILIVLCIVSYRVSYEYGLKELSIII